MASQTRQYRSFDVLRATASDLRDQLKEGLITSLEIVQAYLAQIELQNHAGARLNAVISMPPRPQLLRTAAELDRERKEGKLRGPLHGIPVLIKDAFDTSPDLRMPTTVGSYALVNSRPGGNAPVVQAMVDRGMIILGKANLTEFCGPKGVPGWSAVGGMCQSAWIPGGWQKDDAPRGETVPAGSSTGSAVAVAAGFCPVSIGTETSGSLTTPAGRADLYSLKITPSSADMNRIYRISANFDSIGAMGKSALDVALVSDILLTQVEQSHKLEDFATKDQPGKDLTIAFVDIEKWRYPEDQRKFVPGYMEQTAKEYQESINRLREYGIRVVYPAKMMPPEEYVVDGTNVDDMMSKIIGSEVRDGCNWYLQQLAQTEVRTLKDIIKFNDDHPELEFCPDHGPNQNILKLVDSDAQSPADVQSMLRHCNQWAVTDGFDKLAEEERVDVLVGPADSYFAGISVAARYPLASLPLSYVEASGRPYGIQAIAKANEEHKIIEFMSVWQKLLPERRVPDFSWADK